MISFGRDYPDPFAQDGAGRKVRLTPAASIKPRPVRWTWTDRVPVGELTMTPGRGGVGKSTFHAWFIANLTRGTLPGVHYGTPRACIIAASEDSWERTIVGRLLVAGSDMNLVYRADVVVGTVDLGTGLTLPADCAELEAEIRRIGAALLSVDPLISSVAGGLDTHKDREVREALQPLAQLADRTGCAVLGNAHFGKASGHDPLALMMGSVAFGNVARAVLGFASDTDTDDGSCVISQVKNNLGRLDLPSLRYVIEEAALETDEGPAVVGRLVMLGESDRSVTDILRDGAQPTDRGERHAAGEWLRGYLIDNGGEAIASDVIKAGINNGYEKHTVQRARKNAGVGSGKSGMRGGWIWRLLSEDDTKTTKNTGLRLLRPSSPSVSPSADLAPCGHPISATNTANGKCALCIAEAIAKTTEQGEE